MSMLQDAKDIISESITAVLPDVAVKRALARHKLSGLVYVVAIGKAAWKMAAAAHDALGDKIAAGVVITKYEHSQGPIPHMEILEAGHPVPDENGLTATKKALSLVENLTEKDHVLFLVSGGGSALFESPLTGITLLDIADITKKLLACGASIVEINTIRKHLSNVKGGRFAMHCAPAHVLSIVLSDVLGDSLDSIASGPAYPDRSTSQDALLLLEKYGIDLPPHMQAALKLETPKTLSNVSFEITGNVTALCQAAMSASKKRGYSPIMLTTTLDSEARDAGAFLAAIAREIKSSSQPATPPCALILGGETVVHLKGCGKGGRNQELALAAAKGIDGLSDVVIFSVGSDGTDGPTDAAGGIVTGSFAGQCREAGLSLDQHLQDNNSYPVLKTLGGLIVTGPTGTNVNDLTVLMCR